jgi:hypothetical protein
MADDISPLHVIVRFGSAIPDAAQGEVMLFMEKHLRRSGIQAEVFKETMVDDSKLRRLMSPAQRAKL